MPLKCVRRPDSPYWWIIGTIGGVRLRESSGTDIRDLAEIRRAARENELYRADVHGPKAVRHPFSVVALSYLEHGGPHSAPTSARVGRLAEHVGPTLAADDVDQARIDKACSALLRSGSAPATRLREVISPARAILMHGSKRRMCLVPMFDAGKPSPSRTEWLTPAEVDALIAASANHIKPLLAFLASTGARLGEALSLDWRDVDLVHNRVLLRDTKSGKDRPVDLCPRAVSALEAIDAPKSPAECSAPGQARPTWSQMTRPSRAAARLRRLGRPPVRQPGWIGSRSRPTACATHGRPGTMRCIATCFCLGSRAGLFNADQIFLYARM
jgi:hypothetical protein